jgi:hypothetical protein
MMLKERTPENWPAVSSVLPARAWRRRGEEGGLGLDSKVIREDAGEESLREEIRKQEVVGVDGVAPGAADKPGLGERAAREAAENVEEHVVGEADTVAVAFGPVHVAGRRRCGSNRKGKAPIEGSMERDRDGYRRTGRG